MSCRTRLSVRQSTYTANLDRGSMLESRLIGHLKIGGWKYGLLINSGGTELGNGIRRLVNPNLSVA